MLDDLMAIARRIKKHNVMLQIQSIGRPWNTVEIMLGFTNDVGTLSRLVMENADLRPPRSDLQAQIGHELADCLWSVLTLADELDVDLDDAFTRLERQIREKKQ